MHVLVLHFKDHGLSPHSATTDLTSSGGHTDAGYLCFKWVGS